MTEERRVTIRAKHAGTCPICDKPWGIGDRISRFKKSVTISGWYDYGMRKGEMWKRAAFWGHPPCVQEHEEKAVV